jgi:hypothetical protein
MNYGTKRARAANFPTLIEKVRLMLGFLMMVTGLYFGVFSAGVGQGIWVLSLMASPFVMITDK